MLHAERKPRYFENQDVSAMEPCSKRIKSAEEPYGKSYDGLKKLHEEVHVKKTHSGFIPLSLSDDFDDYNIKATRQQEKETAEDLHPFNRAIADKKTEPSNSFSNTQVTGSQCPLSTDNAVDNKKNNVVQKDKNKGDSELYTTSKVFIGPIYKTEADCRRDGRNQSIDNSCQNVLNTKLAGRSKKMPPQQPLPYHLPKIEDELSQFYSEIDQLESNENYLDGDLQGTETNSQGQPVEYNKLDQSFSVNSQEWSCRAPPSWNNGQCSYTNSGVHNISHKQYLSSDSTVFRNSNTQCYNSQKAIWETEQLCNKQEGSRFWSTSVPEFKPGWAHTHPFITPYGPPPPQCNTHFNFQEPSSSSFHSAIFSPPNVGPFKNVPINMNCSADQNSEYTSRFGTPCAPTSRNGYNVPDRRAVNGFCETQTNRKDVRTSWTEGLSTGSQHFSKDRLCESQKLLIVLRGLPGSGKTTLSHVLLGQSRDGIVFSTDDYFCQNNGWWSYNIAQLGAAHDWNQKRAKQAMDQGRSPIIIDNTNTQAWEMKPYVEVALEKGYQVEFHEPDTWWKFNPEELEKRNKHGVSREKIVQMLERYEYHMSVPIVMNSVLPFHKTSQRPPSQGRQRDSVVKKPHRFYKTKQRRKRKRNKKMKGVATKTIGKRSDGDFSPSDDDSSQSGQEDLENNGESPFVTGPPVEHKESEDSSAKDSNLKHSELHNRTFLDSNMMDSVASDNSPNAKGLARDSDLSLMSLLSATDEIVAEQSFQLCGTQRLNIVKSESRILECNSQSTLKLNSGTDKLTAVRSIENEDKVAGVILELSVESSLLSNREEVTALQQEALQNTEKNSWAFFSTDMVEKQQEANSDKNEYLTWPEDSSVIMYEQRPKKERGSKQIFSETGELTDYKFSKKSVEQEDGEMLVEKSDIRDFVVPSLQTENTCKMPCIAVGDFPTESRTEGSISNDATLLASPRKNRRCKRIFKLAPNFDFPRQIAAKNDQEVIKDVDALMEQDGISNKGTREKKKPSLGHYGCPAHSSYDTVTVQMSTVSCEASLPNDRQLVPFNQIMKTNKEEKQDKMPSDVSATQPDILSSIKEISGCHIDAAMETLENIQQFNETEQIAYSQIRDDQNPLSTNSKFGGLPLSLGFAVQLVERFGSPGVPLGNYCFLE